MGTVKPDLQSSESDRFLAFRNLIIEAKEITLENKAEIDSLISKIYDVVSKGWVLGARRSRRGYFDFLGDVIHKVAGLATDSDLKDTQDRVNAILDMIRDTNKQSHDNLESLRAGERILGKRVSNMVDALAAHADATAVLIGDVVGKVDRHLEWLAHVQKKLVRIQHDTALILAHLRQFYGAVQLL